MIADGGATRPLTVVVLTYNSERTLRTCLDALVAQKEPAFSVLIVDDSSTDGTLDIVHSYDNVLDIRIATNGSHNIATGRNIGIRNAQSTFVAFVDSDDSPAVEWTHEILKTFSEEPNLALISGELLPHDTTPISRAIGTNDEAIRRLFGGDVFLFCSANCALNKDLIAPDKFDEHFRYAEDVEFASRVGRRHKWKYVPTMKVNHTSREGLRQYGTQMYRYGSWRIYYGVRAHDFRLIDFVPLSLITLSVVAAAALRRPVLLSAIVVFSLMESAFVVVNRRPSPTIALLTIPAWLVKNVAWSLGVVRAAGTLLTNKSFRDVLRTPDFTS